MEAEAGENRLPAEEYPGALSALEEAPPGEEEDDEEINSEDFNESEGTPRLNKSLLRNNVYTNSKRSLPTFYSLS